MYLRMHCKVERERQLNYREYISSNLNIIKWEGMLIYFIFAQTFVKANTCKSKEGNTCYKYCLQNIPIFY